MDKPDALADGGCAFVQIALKESFFLEAFFVLNDHLKKTKFAVKTERKDRSLK